MNAKEITRWIGLLPCALIGSAIATIMVVVMCLIGDIFDGTFWIYLTDPKVIHMEHFFTPFISTAVFCGAFVLIGAVVAPKYKKQVAYALSIVIAILFGVLAFFAVLTHEWKTLAQCVFGIIVAAIAAYNENTYD